MQLSLRINDERFTDMGLSQEEQLEIIRQEIQHGTFPLSDVLVKMTIDPVSANSKTVVNPTPGTLHVAA